MSNVKRVLDLVDGDGVDVPPEWVRGTDNEAINECEYAAVESVMGGWADNIAGPDEVVIYTHNFGSPIIAPRDATVTVVAL